MLTVPIPSATAPIPAGLDGIGICSSSSCCRTTLSPPSVCWESLSTSYANDLVVLLARCSDCTVRDSSGLSYKLRATSQGEISNSPAISEYYALATPRLSFDNVSVSCDVCDGPFFQVFAIHGYDVKMFDPAAPIFVDCSRADDNSTPCHASITTSSADLVFAGVTTFAAPCTSPSGWTRLGGGSFFASDAISRPLGATSLSYSCIHYVDNGREAFATGIMIIDAIPLSSGPTTR